MARKRQPPTFEEALKELEGLVQRMEQGDMSLEEALKAFERGVELTNTCRAALDDAEQRVEILSKQGLVQPFEPGQSEDG